MTLTPVDRADLQPGDHLYTLSRCGIKKHGTVVSLHGSVVRISRGGKLVPIERAKVLRAWRATEENV